MDVKIKHLEFIQATINRMAGNSFLLKSWSAVVVGALFTLSFKELNRLYLLVSVAVLLSFWLLDAYYLSREHLFIKLYDSVRKKNEAEIDFSMDTSGFEDDWAASAFSKTMKLFYGGLLVVQAVVMIIL